MNLAWNPAAGDLFPGSLAVSVAGALWAWLLAWLLGASLLPPRRDPPESPGGVLLTWAVFGVAIQTTAWLVLSFVGVLTPVVVVGSAAGLTVAGAAVGGRRIVRLTREAWGRARASRGDALFHVALLVLGVVTVLALRLALWPTVFYDDLVYHVAAPRQALLTGVWPAMPGMHYSFMPAGWDAAYLLPLALGGGSGPQLMNVVALALFAWAIHRLARLGAELGSALASAALLVAAPVTISLGAFAGNDLYVALALAVALERLVATRGRRPVAVGLLAGAAWGAKYTALAPAAGIALAAAVLPAPRLLRRAARALTVGVVTLAVPFLWTARSWILTGNPIYPAFYAVLGGRYWDPQSAAIVARHVSHGGWANRGPAAFALALVDLVRRSGELGFPSGVNPLFVLLGLAGLLWMRRVRGGAALAVTAGVTYVGWCVTSLNVRYALILLAALAPFTAAVIGAGGRWLATARAVSARRVLLPALLLLAVAGPVVDGVGRHVRYYGAGTSFFGGTPRRDMQVTRLNLAAAGRAAAADLPRDARILLVGDGRVGLMPRPALASSAYDRPDAARFLAGARSVPEVNTRLRSRGFTHVVVNFRELDRFEKDYGFAGRFGPGEWDLFQSWLREGLEPLAQYGTVVIYRIPAEPRSTSGRGPEAISGGRPSTRAGDEPVDRPGG